MFNLINIMKITVTFAAAIYLLRASAAYLPFRNGKDHHGKLVNQPGEYHALVNNLASSDYVEVEGESDMTPTRITPAEFILQPPSSESSSKTNELSIETPVSSSSSLRLSSKSAQWAIVYHPYNSDSTCRNRATVHAHMTEIARLGFSTIRLHNHDCSILAKLAASPEITSQQIRLILGIHIDETGLDAAEPLVDEVVAWASEDPLRWASVEMVVVGEEAIFNGHVRATDLAEFIGQTRSTLRTAGYTGPLTTTEPLHVLADGASTLCPALDVLASNIHPFFHADVPARDAGAFVRNSLHTLEEICPGLRGLNLETGWPHRGLSNGQAVPSPAEQGVAIQSIMEEAGERSVVLGFGDDGWMEEGEFGVEGSWGCDSWFG